jgi:ribosome production factor 1
MIHLIHLVGVVPSHPAGSSQCVRASRGAVPRDPASDPPPSRGVPARARARPQRVGTRNAPNADGQQHSKDGLRGAWPPCGMGRGSLGGGAKATGIKNKAKRVAIYQRSRKEGEKQARVDRKARQKETEALGESAPDRSLQQRTLDNTRDADETVVQPGDEEIAAEDSFDEFSRHFAGDETPSIVVTTSQYPSKKLLGFMEEIISLLPNAEYRQRGAIPIKAVVQAASKRGFTMLLVFTEGTGGGSAGKRSKVCQGLWMVKLARPGSGIPSGPTARFKVSNVVMPAKITGHGRPTSHRPELILNNFSTRLGHRVGRMLGCLVPHDPQFRGRQVVTMHNQRDFIFFRHHRYIFEERGEGKAKRVVARLQELGPRFTLRLKSLQMGTFDTQHGEYEWKYRSEFDRLSRRRFHL